MIIGLCVIATIAAGTLHYAHANAVLAFAVTAAALALLAMIVGDATEQLGSRLGPGATPRRKAKAGSSARQSWAGNRTIPVSMGRRFRR